VPLVRTDISEVRIASIIRVKDQQSSNDVSSNMLGTANVPSSLILFTLMVEAKHLSKTLVLTIATRRHMPEEGVIQNQT
jgi:hypothetical protein